MDSRAADPPQWWSPLPPPTPPRAQLPPRVHLSPQAHLAHRGFPHPALPNPHPVRRTRPGRGATRQQPTTSNHGPPQQQGYSPFSNAPVQCLVCTDYHPPTHITHLPCGHSHCNACILLAVQSSLNSYPFQPIRCCHPSQPIPIIEIRRALTRSGLSPSPSPSPTTITAGTDFLLQRYREMLSELATPQPLYCHDPQCASFIPPVLCSNYVGRCRKCHKRTCVVCRGAYHMSWCYEPPRLEEGGKGLGELRALAWVMGWKRCPECRHLVEKTEGCNHIVCVCGCHWCFRCGRAPYGNHGVCAM